MKKIATFDNSERQLFLYYNIKFSLSIDSDESEGGPATSSRHLATTDDFHDDGKVDKLDADIALNLTLDEVNKKVNNKHFVMLKIL